MKRKYITLLVLVGLWTAPAITNACPLCQAGATKKTQKAYEQTTALLALIPLIGGGGIFYWMYSRSKKRNSY